MQAFKIGGLVTVGFAAQKILSNVLRKQVFDRIFAPAAAPAPAPTSGLGALSDYNPLLAGVIATVGGVFVTNMVVKKAETKQLIWGGLAAGLLHNLIVWGVGKLGQPALVDMLSGDATAARLSAMYGYGGTSLQPHYAPIGEYFREMSGLGATPLYQAAAGMGAYGANPDIYQAAAGYGDNDTSYGYGNHIPPSSDLDRELTIAEAAAGVGAIPSYEANAGTGEYFTERGMGEYFREMAGLGDVKTLPAADTWVPGMADPQIWAGTRAVSDAQSQHMMVPAGVLESGGGQGIFG